MNFQEMSIEELQARKAEIVDLSKDNQNVEELRNFNQELDSINAELETRKNKALSEEEQRKAAEQKGKITTELGEKTMDQKEIRSSKEYINAYVNYLKGDKDTECRALLSINATDGVVPVPTLVEEKIRHAWESNELTSLAKLTFLKGNLNVGFEASADPAEVHDEGDDEPDEEELVIGIASLIPESIKKWITISDEAYDLAGEAFLNYIYDEISYQIAKKAADIMIADVAATQDTSDATHPGQASLTQDVAIDTIVKALAKLGDEAVNPVVVLHKETWGDLKAAALAANYARDVFEGCRVIFNNSLPTAATATAGATFIVVGDFANGYQWNFPNGEEIKFRFDENSLAEKDLVKVVGRRFGGHAVVAPKSFVKVKKPAAPAEA